MLGFLGGLEVVLLCLFGGLIGLACFVLWIWMLIDCLTNHGIPGSEKVAWVLVILGASVAVVEEGPSISTAEFQDRAFPALRRLYRDMGSQIARGRAYIPVLQGSCLGGSTVVNSAIMWRLPEDVWESWDWEHGLGRAIPIEDLHRHRPRHGFPPRIPRGDEHVSTPALR